MDLEMWQQGRRSFGQAVHLIFLWTIHVVCLGAQDMSNPNSDPASQESRVFYTRIDELPPNVVVGNVVRDANLHRKYGPDVLDTFVLEIIGGNHKQYFQMETEVVGNLRTAAYLDRDIVCQSVQDCHLTLDIAVVRPPQYFQIIQVTLTMLDNNDNSPQFSEPETTVFISENAVPPVSFVLPTASDPDSGLYGIQSYSIVRRSSKFDLELMDSGDGGQDLRLKLLSRLNREDRSSYSLQVQAKDGGLPPRIGILEIQVIVADANDNTPEFQLSVYNVSIPEDHPIKSAFLRVQATDPDQGLNGQVQYSLATQTMESYGDTFAINRDSGELSLLRAVDYEVQTNYHLLVTAQDQGPDSVPVHARVVVNILDVNDFIPQIAVNAWTKTGRIEVLENEAGSFLAHVSVDDQDRGPSGQVTCNLTDTRFALEYMYTNTYKIITQTQLDRELEDMILLTVYCKDRGQPSLSSSVEVTVHVLDQNDHSPQFEQVIYSSNVLETAPIGTSVIRVRASDDDIDDNAQITYHLHANSNNMLRVSPDTGVVITNSLLDHEHVESLRFFVLAIDNGHSARTATATVLLQITDVNDEKPIFLQHSYTFGTLENQAAGTEIGTVSAEDNDTPPNDEFHFSLNDNSTFSIHPTSGLITTNKLLDREHQDAYYLTVTAQNTQPPYLSGTVSLTIYVADKNDNAPKITFPRTGNNTVEVSVFSPAGYIVTRVNASDVDSGTSGKLEFTFGKGNEDYMFGIDPFSGIITVEGDLSDSDNSDYSLLVLVRDQGESQKSAVATLNVVINKTMVFAELAKIPPKSADDGDFGLGFHEQILIIIGAITLVVVSLLILAIICIKRRQGTRERDSYKYMCRVDMAKPSAKQADTKEQSEKCAVIAGSQDMDKRMVKFNMEGPSPNQSGSFNSLGYPPGMDFPDKHVGLVTSTPQDPGSHPTHPSHTCPLHGNRSAPLGTFQRPADQTGQHLDKVQLSAPEKRDTVDSDSTSGCSADMSNSDSGRGPSEEGDPSHHRYHIHPKVKSADYVSGRNKPMGPHLPPRTTSLTKNRSQTGCHGYRTDSHDSVNVNKPTQFSKVPNKDIIGRGPGFRNVTMNYNGDKTNSTQNLRTFSPGPGYAVEKNPAEMSSGEAINV